MFLKKFSAAVFIFIFAIFATEISAADDEVDKPTVDTTSTYDMPKLESSTNLEIYRPVRFHTEDISVGRILQIKNYYDSYTLFFEKGTKIRDKNGDKISEILTNDAGESETFGPTIAPPRKTLGSGLPRPTNKLLAPFFVLFGNPCLKENENCDAVEYFSPVAKMILPYPNDTFKKGNFAVEFFDCEKKVWEKVDDFVAEDSTKLIKIPVEKAGLVAIVSRNSSARLSQQLNDDEMLLVVPKKLQNSEFQLQSFENQKWKNLEFTRDPVDKNILKIKKTAGIISFIPKIENQNCAPNSQNSSSQISTNLSANIFQNSATQNLNSQTQNSATENSNQNSADSNSQNSANSQIFADVKNGDWFAAGILKLVENGAIEKDATRNFSPSKKINRAEVATLLQKIFDLPTKSTVLADLKNDDWFAAAAQNAISLGIFAPILGNNFYSYLPVSRVEALVSLLRAAKIKIPADFSAAEKLNDVSVDYEFCAEISFAQKNEIAGVGKNFFNLHETVSKAEFAKMAGAVLEFIENADDENFHENFGEKLPEKIALFESEKKSFKNNFLNFETHSDIFRLKKFLKILGFFDGEFNENFDENLSAALLEFQLQKNIIPNSEIYGAGLFGNATRAAINSLLAEF